MSSKWSMPGAGNRVVNGYGATCACEPVSRRCSSDLPAFGGPSSNGFSMPSHYGHKRLRIVAQSSPTGTQYLQAVGTAMGARWDRTDEVVYVSSGEGATSEGEFHEALNWAARGRFPVVFLIQNNKFAISVTKREQTAAKSVYGLMSGYEGLNRYEIDGCDFIASYETAVEAAARARAGEGPSLILAHTVRLLPHSSSCAFQASPSVPAVTRRARCSWNRSTRR